jgi:hypothetical protein
MFLSPSLSRINKQRIKLTEKEKTQKEKITIALEYYDDVKPADAEGKNLFNN